MNIADKFTRLKTRVAGNTEIGEFDFTFRRTPAEINRITDMPRSNKRILSELEFALHLSEAKDGSFDETIDRTLDFLGEELDKNSVLTDEICERAEQMILPLESAAKEYEMILISHAHIDMNWQWGYDETVAITLSTFRTILNIMNEYPDFTFMQSQASVYRIVEEHDPDMMEEIKARIHEGRWEVTANAWVETDKNMPDTESLIRHIECTREYLNDVWGVSRSDIDFSPDTFGHSANIPEINNYAGVKYYYHCRGNKRPETLYRFRAQSGKEVLAYREPVWYNGSVTPHIGSSAVEISKLSGGFKTIPLVYGVGDHGGGPTRRDIERALEMMEWRIYPTIRFGTLHEYFDKAMCMWDKLPVVDEELNYFSPGCYTTQSRIKRGNRRLEASLYNAESMSALACRLTDFRYAKAPLTKAWRELLFTHFHDILTGSCVPESREHAMGLYQSAAAVANTQISNAMYKIASQIDTSSIQTDIDAYNSRSEGAGVGYGARNFVGVPNVERGSGKTRIFHIFNTLPVVRKETVELTVWDWTGDLKRLDVRDLKGEPVPCQPVDSTPQPYWDHTFVRVLVEAEVAALGYTTVVIYEREAERYPVYLQDDKYIKNRGCTGFDDYVLENKFIKATVDVASGRLVSVVDKKTGAEQLKGVGAGFTYIETECATSDAWNIGRHIADIPLTRCIRLKKTLEGQLCTRITANYEIKNSKLEIVYSLDRNSKAVRIDAKIDWREHGMDNSIIPVLDYRVPLAYDTDSFMYDIPAGTVCRGKINHDVPALKFGMAQNGDRGTVLISDCKYGYRASGDTLALTLINSSVRPDRYPELGIHNVSIWLGVCGNSAYEAETAALCCDRQLLYQPSNTHSGVLPMEYGLFSADGGIISAVRPKGNGTFIRLYENEGRVQKITLTFANEIKNAVSDTEHSIDGKKVIFELKPHTIADIEVEL